jgi:hypothetical protein
MAAPQSAPPSAPPQQPSSPTTIYRTLTAYPFDSDPEYLSGLASILGHPDTAPSQEELASNPDLILQARCFYFARRSNLQPIDPTAYRQWLAQNSSAPSAAPQETTTFTTGAGPAPQPQAQRQPPAQGNASQPPPYPTSFAEIVDLITRNVPVPGIEEIPDTVLEHGSSKVDRTPRRRKPWESDGEGESEELPVMSVMDEASAGEVGNAGTATGENENGTDARSAVEAGQEEQAQPSVEASTGTDVNGHLATGEGLVKILQEGAIPDSGLLAKD